MIMNLPCLRGSCPNFLRSIYHSLSASQAPKRGACPTEKKRCRLQLLFLCLIVTDLHSPVVVLIYSVDAIPSQVLVGLFADAVRSGLHTILRLHGLHPFHPLIPHFSLHSSRFNWLYCNHVLLVLHYARYFSCLLLPVL